MLLDLGVVELMVRMSSTAQKDATTGDLVYARAVDLIYEYGFHGTALRPIAERVGVQMSTLYHYFPSKQDILLTIMTTAMQDMTNQVLSAIQGQASPKAALQAAIRAHIEFHAERLKEAVIADSELRSLEGEGRKRIIEMRDEYEHLFRSILEDGQRAGEFRDVNAVLTTRALLGAITDVGNWYHADGPLSLAKIAEEYARLFVDGIAAHTVR